MAGRYSVETIFRAVDRMSAPISRMQARIGRFSRSAQAGLRKVADIGKQLTGSLAKMGVAASAAFVAAAGGMGLLMYETAKANTEMAAMSKAMGVTESSTRAMNAILSGAGMTWENYTDQIEELRNKLGERKAAGEMKKFDEAIGYLNLKWSELKNLRVDQVYSKILGAMRKIKDPTKRAFISDEIFGGEGNKIIGVIDATGKSLEELFAYYDKLDMYNEAGRKGTQKFMDALSPFLFIISSIKSQITGLVGGALTPYIESMTMWTQANKELLSADITRLVDNLTKLFEKLLPSVEANETWIGKLADGVGWLADNTELLETWLKRIYIGVAIFAALTAAAQALIVVMAAVNLVMAANPIVLITLAIIALVTVIGYLIAKYVYLGAVFGAVWGGIIALSKGAASIIGSLIDGMISKITGLIGLATTLPGKVKGFFTGGSASSAGSNVSSPQQRTANTISEKRNTSEVTIRDESGKAKLTKGTLGQGVRLQHTGK